MSLILPLLFLGMRRVCFMHWTLVAQTSVSCVCNWVEKKNVLLSKNSRKFQFLPIWWLEVPMWVLFKHSKNILCCLYFFHALKSVNDGDFRLYLITLLQPLLNLLLLKVKVFMFLLVDKGNWVLLSHFQWGKHQFHRALSLNGPKDSR